MNPTPATPRNFDPESASFDLWNADANQLRSRIRFLESQPTSLQPTNVEIPSRRRLRKSAAICFLIGVASLAAMLLCGCSTTNRESTVANYRKALPFVSTPLPTGSMQPILVAGQKITHWWEPYSSIKVGDLVGRVDPWGNQVIIHRVIRNEGTADMPRWVTKGDHNQRPDAGYMFEDSYVGKWAPIVPVGVVTVSQAKTP